MTHDTVDADYLRSRPLPAPGSSKEDRGDVLVVGGARATPGAVALAGLGALRAGAGRLTLAVAESVAPALAAGFPEAAVLGLPERGTTVAGKGAAEMLERYADADCVLLGPGLDDPDETAALLAGLADPIPSTSRVLLDAYALGAVANDPQLCAAFAGRLLMTPNGSEAERLLGRELSELKRDVPEIARRYRATVTCHDWVADGDGTLLHVPVGGPGLGTSGSGDVLAGILAGLSARGTDDLDAVAWATYLHGQAGDRLAGSRGPLGLLARELADEIPALMAALG